MSATIKFPLNEVQTSLLKLTENLSEEDLKILKKLIIAFKAQRLAALVDKVWDEKGWTEETMQTFLNTHMRTLFIQPPIQKILKVVIDTNILLVCISPRSRSNWL